MYKKKSNEKIRKTTVINEGISLDSDRNMQRKLGNTLQNIWTQDLLFFLDYHCITKGINLDQNHWFHQYASEPVKGVDFHDLIKDVQFPPSPGQRWKLHSDRMTEHAIIQWITYISSDLTGQSGCKTWDCLL